MKKISKKEKRLIIFQYGAKAAAKYRNGDSSLYFCPICSNGYTEKFAVNGELTLEDVPPKSIGGKPILLTCRACNSGSGDTIDSALANRNKLQDFARIVTGQKTGKVPSVKLTFGDNQVTTFINRKSTSCDIKPVKKANAPNIIESFKKHMLDISRSGADGYEFKLSKTVKYNDRFAKLGYLKSSFLLLFAWLGYRYAFDPCLNIVREQILNPEIDIIGTKFWVEIGKNTPSNKIMFTAEPLPMLLVSFKNFCIILPDLEYEDDIYSSLSDYWEKGEKINIQAKILDNWPNQLQMNLDMKY